MDYIKGIDIQARMRYYDERDHYEMCLEALEWYRKRASFDLHQIHWRVARSCFKYYGYLVRSNKEEEGVKVLEEMEKYAKETVKTSECHPMGQKYLAIGCWLRAKTAIDDAAEIDLLVECKKLLDKSVETLPEDHEVRQYRGLWNYRVASVNRVSRIALRLVKGFVIPKGSIDEAIKDLSIADQTHQLETGRPNFRTVLLIGLCSILKGKLNDAMVAWSSCQTMSIVESAIDGDLMQEELHQFKERIESIFER